MSYRSIKLELMPDSRLEKTLKWGEVEAIKFIQLSKNDYASRLYHQFTNESELGTRTIALLVHRFTGSFGGKAFIPFDESCSKFINESGCWFVEAALMKGGRDRIRIPVAKTGNKDDDVIEDCVGLPFVIVREDDRWFAYMSASNDVESNSNIVGIDFNERVWVVSGVNDKPLFFDVSGYHDEVERLQDLIGRANRKCEIGGRCRYCKRKCEVQELYDRRSSVMKRCQGDFLAEMVRRWGICRLGIECIETMYAMVHDQEKSRSVKSWLNSKLAMRKFVMRATAKGFDVVEVDPAYTSRRCHRCGELGEIYGDHHRLFRCKCGLRDYNRDLNASRNIAKLALNLYGEESRSTRLPPYVSGGLPVNLESGASTYMGNAQNRGRGVERAATEKRLIEG